MLKNIIRGDVLIIQLFDHEISEYHDYEIDLSYVCSEGKFRVRFSTIRYLEIKKRSQRDVEQKVNYNLDGR